MEAKAWGPPSPKRSQVRLCCASNGLLVHCFRLLFIGKHGWISLKVSAAPLDWHEIYGLLKGSHELVSAKNGRSPASRRT